VPERKGTEGRVENTLSVIRERIVTYGGVFMTSCIAEERIITKERIDEVPTAFCASRSTRRRKRKTGEHEREHNERDPQARPTDQIFYG